MSKEEAEVESVEQIIESPSNLFFVTFLILGIIFLFTGFLLIILSIFSLWPILSIWPVSLSTSAMSTVMVAGVFLVLDGFIMVLLYRVGAEGDNWLYAGKVGQEKGRLIQRTCRPIQVSQNNVQAGLD